MLDVDKLIELVKEIETAKPTFPLHILYTQEFDELPFEIQKGIIDNNFIYHNISKYNLPIECNDNVLYLVPSSETSIDEEK